MVYTSIRNLALIRNIAVIFPLKRKLNFLISRYLKNENRLKIPFAKNWDIYINVSENNHSTISNLILEGSNSQPEGKLLKRLHTELPDNMTLVDVGGNIGSFFCQFINKCSKVYVFEPIPRLYKVIQESIKLNHCQTATLITKAVGDIPGHVKMLDNNNSNVVADVASAEEIIDINVTTLDIELENLQSIDLLKIDVEGYELHVLQGAHKIINQHKPFMLIEVHPGFLQNYHKSHTDIIAFVEEHNYSIEYFSFLAEERDPKWKRILHRWYGNNGLIFSDKKSFLKDVDLDPKLMSYHLFCKPLN